MDFYTYVWLREDGTPYYVGKGKGSRAYDSYSGHRPPSRDRIIVQAWPCETEAFEAEILLIAVYGRKDNGTGILHNHTNGGQGQTGHSAWNKGLRVFLGGKKIQSLGGKASGLQNVRNGHLKRIRNSFDHKVCGDVAVRSGQLAAARALVSTERRREIMRHSNHIRHSRGGRVKEGCSFCQS